MTYWVDGKMNFLEGSCHYLCTLKHSSPCAEVIQLKRPSWTSKAPSQ